MKKLILLMLLLSCCFAQSVGDTISKSVADVKLVERTETCSPDTCRLTFEYCLKVPIATTDKYTWEYLDKNLKSETLNHNLYLLEWQNVSKTRIDYTPYICNITTYDNKTEKNITEEGTCYNAKEVSYSVMEQVEVPFTTFSGCRNITWKGVGLPLGMHDVIPVIDGISYPEFTEIYVSYPYYIEDDNSTIWFRGNATTDNTTQAYVYINWSNGTLSDIDSTTVLGDRFNDSSVNTDKFYTAIGSGSITQSDGYVWINCSASNYAALKVNYTNYPISTFNNTLMVARLISATGNSIRFGVYNQTQPGDGNAGSCSMGTSIDQTPDRRDNYCPSGLPAPDFQTMTPANLDFTTPERWQQVIYAVTPNLINMTTPRIQTLGNGTNTTTVTRQTPTYINPSPGLMVQGNAGATTSKWDYLFFVKYEPTVSVSCGDIETDSYSVGGGTATSRILCNISTGVNVSDYQFSIPYSLVNDTNLLITNESAADPPNPEISELSLLPPVAYYDEDLNCSFTVNDSDTPSVNITVDWLKNGVSSHSVSMPNMASNTKNWTILEYGNTSVGDNWACLVNATDGVYTASNLSANSTIINYTWPDVYLITPANNSEYYVASKTFAWICNDSETSALNAELYIGGILYASTTCTNNTICSELASTDIACGPGTWHVYCEDLSGRSNTSGTFNISFRPEFTYEFPTPSNNSVLGSKLPVTINISATCEPSAGYIEFNATNMTATCASDFCHYTNDSRSDGNYIVFGWMQSSNGTWYASAWLNYTSLYGAVIVDFNITKNYTTSEMMEYIDTFLLEDWWDEIFVILSFAFPFLLTRRISVMLLAGSAGLLFVFFFTMNFMYLVGAILVGLIGWIMKMFTG